MNLYILPVHRILLEYVLKLGDMIFFPGNVSNDDIELSSLCEYQIPIEPYNCTKLYKNEIYEILYGNANYIDNLCKRSLVNICESEYVSDWTQRIS